jgi:hypothetical protein
MINAGRYFTLGEECLKHQVQSCSSSRNQKEKIGNFRARGVIWALKFSFLFFALLTMIDIFKA